MVDWSPIAKKYDPLKAGSIDGTDTEPHDHGVVRAINAQYKPNRLVTGDPRCTLFVGKLNPKTTEGILKEYFRSYGDIRHCRLIRDFVTGFSKCYGFVEFKERQDASRAYSECYKDDLQGYEIFVDYESERSLPGWIPRRLGGGFGGKKESGQLRFGGRDRPFKKPILIGENRFNSNWRNKGDRESRPYQYKQRDFKSQHKSNYSNESYSNYRSRESSTFSDRSKR